MKKPAYLTISVDDGHPTDLRSADLLQKFGLKATFYIPAHNRERDLMSSEMIRDVEKNFELGSHTFNHKPLHDLAEQEARAEINDGKKWLEDLTGREVVAFCYPRGKFNYETIKLVREAGFLGARTCMFNLNSIPRNPFLWGVSTHGYSHSVTIQLRHALLENNIQGIFNFVVTHKMAQDWTEHFTHAVNFVDKNGGVAHLYFHSWEIEEQNQWKTLENLLKNTSKQTRLTPVTNGDLLKLWHANQ